MRPEYEQWLDQKYTTATKSMQIQRILKVEEYYGDVEEHFNNNSYQEIIDSLVYSTNDERNNKPNPSKIKLSSNVKSIRNNLSSYKDAVRRYIRFLEDSDFELDSTNRLTVNDNDSKLNEDITQDDMSQKFSLEKDMQLSLRKNIQSLDSKLTIIDDGAERTVNSGLIDITCKDKDSIVVIELKAGKADSRAIGQILGYMGDIQEEEEKPVRGILVAHEFDRRVKAAAKVVPTLTLMQYSIDFNFHPEE